MVRIQLRRDRIIFRRGGRKYELTIEPRYWRNPLRNFGLLIIPPTICYFVYPGLLSTFVSANLLAAAAIPVAVMVLSTGRLTFGPQFFIGVGGYTAALLSVHFGFGPGQTIIPAILMSLAFGFLLSLLTVVAGGLYYTLLTLFVPLIFLELTFVFSGIFKGDVGLSPVVRLVTLPTVRGSYLVWALLSLLLAGIYLLAAHKTINSRFGLAMAAVNDDEEVARTMGVDVNKIKIFGFAITAALVGVVGWFWAHFHGTFAGVSYLPLTFAVRILLAIIIGGRAQIYGCVIGAYAVTFLETALIHILGPYSPWVYMILLLVLLIALPEGLFGLHRKRRYREYLPVMHVRR